MNLYIIWQEVNDGYGTYDSAVVVAESEEEAKKIHPAQIHPTQFEKYGDCGEWAPIDCVKSRFLGVAEPGSRSGVICASFNAG